MKKKTLAVLLIGLLALSLTVFAACNMDARRNHKNSADSGSTSEHEHDYDTIVVPPTCEKTGFTTYVCKICGFAFADDYVDATGHDWNDGEVTTPATFETLGETTYTCTVCGTTRTEDIPQLLHSYSEEWSGDGESHWHACTDEGYGELKESEAAHDWNDGEMTIAATCEAAGETTYTCTICGKTKTEPIAQLVHNYAFDSFEWDGFTARAKYVCTNDASHLTYFNVNVTESVTTPPTCTETGIKTYIASFGGYTDVKTEVIAATGHDYVYNSFVWDGYTAKAKYICSNDSNHVDLRTATVTSEVTTAPTCTTTGVRTYTATYGEHTDTKTETLSALGHDLIVHEAQAATCTTVGWNAYEACTRCDYSTYVAIAATGHDYVFDSFVWTGYTAKAKYICSNDSNHVDLRTATVTSEVTTSPICTATGVKTYTATYDGHSATKTETLAAIGHNYVYNSFVWDGYTAKAKYVCSHDSSHVDLRNATVTNQVTTAPTCAATGVRTYTATYDGHSATKTETIAPIGHNYVFDSFVWDEYTAQAKYVCSHDSNHVEMYAATVEDEVTTEPTCTTTGVRTYTATYDGHSATKTETIAALGHNYEFDSFVWTGYTAKAKYICSNDSNHVDLRTATVTSEVTTMPTCTATGVKTYTATYDGHSATKTETLSATGHNYVYNSFVWTGYTAKAKYICSHDSQHVDLRTATVKSQVTTQPTCTTTGVRTYTATYDGHSATKTENIEAKGGYILFGEYPQTIKADDVTITSTRDSRGYYLGSDGAYYAKLTTDLYANGYTFTTGATIQSGTVYYFKVEPIKWRILEDYGGTATILCEMIIDAHAYQSDYSIYDYFTTANGAPEGTYANNYEYSEIRRWLNENFYETAFSELEKGIINTVWVDNSASSTMADGSNWNKGENEYACASTYDKVWLMSEEEVTKSWKYVNYASYRASDTQRRKKTTDYAKANYADTCTSSDYYGNGYWWLRSPNHRDPFSSRCIVYDGYAYDRFVEVYSSSVGVVPALQITLDESTPIVHDIVNHEARAATCTRIGWNAYETCTHCDYTTYEEIPVLGHKGVNHEAKEPTCTEIGWKAYKTCTRCDYSTYEEIPALGHNYSGGVCTRCGEADPNYNSGNRAYVRVDEDGNESATGGYILFGEYPQTVKADSVTITSTTDSRGYYLSSDGAYYAKVTANPRGSGYTFTTGATIESGTVYYFKVEPIKWRILEDDDGTATILCEMIIDAHAYQSSYTIDSGTYYTTANGAPSGTYANNYEYSEIRKWLNDNFYQTAFSELERGIINTVQVDNSAKSTMAYGETWNGGVNNYACADTYDKVWLMSEEEITKSWKYVDYASYDDEDTQRCKQTTDYARANNAWTYTYDDDYGNGWWWLRSPWSDRSDISLNAGFIGNARNYSLFKSLYVGVVPALQITLGESAPHVHDLVEHEAQAPTCTEKGWNAYETCTRCDYTTYEEIAALGHNVVHYEAVEATCEEGGNIEYYYCERCGRYFNQDEVEIPEDEVFTPALEQGDQPSYGVGCEFVIGSTYQFAEAVYFRDFLNNRLMLNGVYLLSGYTPFDSYGRFEFSGDMGGAYLYVPDSDDATVGFGIVSGSGSYEDPFVTELLYRGGGQPNYGEGLEFVIGNTYEFGDAVYFEDAANGSMVMNGVCTLESYYVNGDYGCFEITMNNGVVYLNVPYSADTPIGFVIVGGSGSYEYPFVTELLYQGGGQTDYGVGCEFVIGNTYEFGDAVYFSDFLNNRLMLNGVYLLSGYTPFDSYGRFEFSGDMGVSYLNVPDSDDAIVGFGIVSGSGTEEDPFEISVFYRNEGQQGGNQPSYGIGSEFYIGSTYSFNETVCFFDYLYEKMMLNGVYSFSGYTPFDTYGRFEFSEDMGGAYLHVPLETNETPTGFVIAGGSGTYDVPFAIQLLYQNGGQPNYGEGLEFVIGNTYELGDAVYFEDAANGSMVMNGVCTIERYYENVDYGCFEITMNNGAVYLHVPLNPDATPTGFVIVGGSGTYDVPFAIQLLYQNGGQQGGTQPSADTKMLGVGVILTPGDWVIADEKDNYYVSPDGDDPLQAFSFARYICAVTEFSFDGINYWCLELRDSPDTYDPDENSHEGIYIKKTSENLPAGFVVAGGSGTQEDPYYFEPIY